MIQKTNTPSGGKNARWRGTVMSCLILTLSFTSAYWLGSVVTPTSARLPSSPVVGLEIDERELSIGTIWEQDGLRRPLSIRNISDRDIAVPQFASSCSCVRVEPHSVIVPARQTIKVDVVLNLAQYAPCATTSATGIREFSAQISPLLHDDEPSSVRWTIRGRVRRTLHLSEGTVVFPRPLVRGEPPNEKSIIVTAQVPLQRLAISCPADFGSVRALEVDPAKKTKWKVTVTPSDKLPVGSFAFDITLQPISRDAGEIPRSHIRVKGLVAADIQAIPSTLLLGAHLLGNRATGEISLVSLGKQPFDVEGVELPPDSATSISTTVTPNHSGKAFRVIQHIAQEGNQACPIRFLIRTMNGEKVSIPAKVVYYGHKTKTGAR